MKGTGQVLVKNRYTGEVFAEKVAGEKWMRWAYSSRLGRTLLNAALIRPAFSRLYGTVQSSELTQPKIESFIKEYAIDMKEFEAGPFSNFNEFFVRKFLVGKRSFPVEPGQLGAVAEGRYTAIDAVTEQSQIPVKGGLVDPVQLLGGSDRAAPFMGGTLIVARLCPVDYHRFHFPDSGRVIDSYRLEGPLHSVNPIAIERVPNVLVTNERHVTLLETEHFGKMAYVEVGALCVGKIVQTHQKAFQRGEEKGFFLFGASTVVIVGERGKWSASPDLLKTSSSGLETWVKLGDTIGRTE